MLWLYRILFVPALLFAAPYYLLRMRRRGGYKRHFMHRFGSVEPLPPKRAGVRRIWLQAVSVGEMLAIGPLLEAFRHDPAVEVYLTTTTSTGFKLARERYEDVTIAIGYFPLDWWLFSARAWARILPDLVILTEGERWPEHIHRAQRRRVPVLCVNARMSDRTFRRMLAWKKQVQPVLRGITHVLACSEHDAGRFQALGVALESITVTGNIKLDLNLPLLTAAEREQLRRELGFEEGVLVLIGSSTWPGEEIALVNTFRALRETGLRTHLLLVPRHAERRQDIEGLLKDSGFRFHLRSRGAVAGVVDITVADTTGELRRLTQLADVVFVGKSLPPHEQGQTPVEAAALGKPIVFGPGMSNFRSIAQELMGYGAAVSVADARALNHEVLRLMQDAAARAKMSAAAQTWHQRNQGAVARTLDVIRAELTRLNAQSRATRAGV